MKSLSNDKKIILFDGVCNLCDTFVQHIIRHDKKDAFRFAAQQSEMGRQIADYLGVDTFKTDSIILYEPGKAYYTKAEAAIRIAKELGGWASWLSVFAFLPKALQNWAYDFVARNRYKWFGKKEHCIIPTAEIKKKFLNA